MRHVAEPFRIEAIFNGDSGTLCDLDRDAVEKQLQDCFSAHGHRIATHWISGCDLSERLHEAATSNANDMVLAAGGDGTLSTAAGFAWKAGKPLAVLPGGTMNLFARSLQIPLDFNAAIAAVAGGHVRPIDIATANDRPFLHQFAVGLHPRMIRLRNELDYNSRVGKIIASAKAAISITSDTPTFTTRMILDGKEFRADPVSAISVSASPFGQGHLPYADRLDTGQLGVYSADGLGTAGAIRLAADIVLGTWENNEHVTARNARVAELSFEDIWPDAKATIDGEMVDLHEPVRIENHPKALKVMIPSPALGPEVVAGA